MYATPARNIIPMRENERVLQCRERGRKEEGGKEAPDRKGDATYTWKKEDPGNSIQQGTQLFGP